MWQTLVGPAIELVKWGIDGIAGHFKHKRELKTLQKKAEIEQAKHFAEIASSADVEAIKDNRNSWKDEWIVGLVTLPIAGCFIPHTAPYVKQGFEILSTVVPEWYVMLYGVVVLSVMGVRMFHKYVLPKIGRK